MPSFREQLPTLAGGLAVGLVAGAFLERLRRQHGTRSKGKAQSSSDIVKSGADLRVDKAELLKVAAACLQKAGAPAENAAFVAEVLVAADCRGVPSHGVNRTEVYCGELRAGLIDGAATPRVVSETASTASVDGMNGLGAVVSKFAMEICIRKAKSTGIGLVVCHHSNHFGIAGFWSEMALKEGLIGMSFTNTSPFLIPTRAKERAGGTNPISCYCPAGNDCFQLDMATTTVPVGKVEVCHRKGQQMPLGWGVDKTGLASTTEPAEVLLGGGLTPVGGLEETAGYKGYGLNMMVEILCGVLGGCGWVGPDVPPWKASRGCAIDYGHCFLCIDQEQVLPGGRFQSDLAKYLARMRGLSPADSLKTVLVPGDPERAEERSAKCDGVRLSLNVAVGLRNLARDLGCASELPGKIVDLPDDTSAPKHLLA